MKTLISEIADYYSAKLAQYGETPRGVDWNGEDSQLLRFAQLSRIIDMDQGFSINDLGCGYGAFYNFLSARFAQFSYLGCDVSSSMERISKVEASRLLMFSAGFLRARAAPYRPCA